RSFSIQNSALSGWAHFFRPPTRMVRDARFLAGEMRMTPLAVFVRTLLKTTAIFIGATVVILHPSLEWTSARGPSLSVTAGQSPREGAVDGLVALLKDSDAGVRRQAAAALGEIGNARAVTGLTEALKDSDADVRQHALSALGEIGDARAVSAIVG